MKILVTGGAGFIGSHVVDAYLAEGHEVAVLDNFSSGKRSNLPDELAVFEGNIQDREYVRSVVEAFEPDVINHHAAQISVVHSVRQPAEDAERNILGTQNILEAARALPRFQKFIYASSGGAMYGNPAELPCVETTVAAPMSPYGLSKYVAEQYIKLYERLHGMPATVLRYSNVYGPRQDPHGEAGVCAIFVERMLANEPVTIYGDGSATRDYVYVGDVAAANVIALGATESDSYNISTGVETSTRQVFEHMREATGYSLEPVNEPLRDGEIPRCFLSARKAEDELGWKATTSFSEGVSRTVAWHKEQR